MALRPEKMTTATLFLLDRIVFCNSQMKEDCWFLWENSFCKLCEMYYTRADVVKKKAVKNIGGLSSILKKKL